MIEIRPDTATGAEPDSIDEVVAHNASVHLELLDDTAIMLMVEDAERHVHLRITHKGRSPMRVWEVESWAKTKEGHV